MPASQLLFYLYYITYGQMKKASRNRAVELQVYLERNVEYIQSDAIDYSLFAQDWIELVTGG